MKRIQFAALLVGALLTTQVGRAENDDNLPLVNNYAKQRAVYNQLGLNLGDVISVVTQVVTPAELLDGSITKLVPAYTPPPSPLQVSLSDYETPLPHNSQRMISRLEKRVLTSYMNNPSDIKVTKFLALYHLIGAAHPNGQWTGPNVEHAIMAVYFLNRAQTLGAHERWIGFALNTVNSELDHLANKLPGVTLEENHPGQVAFSTAMFYHEEQRYTAYAALLDDYIAAPNNAYTNLLLSAVNLWTGGEAGYDDPTVLYNFAVGSYFSFHASDLAQLAETLWQADPVNHSRFRLGSLQGGFSAPQRRFLAKLVKDSAAVDAIDAEHKQWWEINPVFHMFTLGYTLWDDHFDEALAYWEQGMIDAGRPDLITNKDRPRYTFNNMSMFLSTMDFYMKGGDLDSVKNFWGPTLPYVGFYSDWALGPGPYQHRMDNLDQIYALYQDNDPSNDPMPFDLKRRKWGMNTMTCQTCHQVQNHVWSQDDINTILIAPDDILTVGTWPKHTTTWFGTIAK
jgi:hypothetical protein